MHSGGASTSIPFDLTGQTAIVTGAATGIGEAIAIRLAAARATIAVVDLDLAGAERVAAALGAGSCADSFAIGADVTQAASVRAAVEEAIRRTGRIDIPRACADIRKHDGYPPS
jgi:NAD(P)-dependent dehydrogenase (short-subunit alcohol dehydrogenase family)